MLKSWKVASDAIITLNNILIYQMVYKEASESQAPEMMSQMRPKYFTNKMRTEELFTNLAEVNIFF